MDEQPIKFDPDMFSNAKDVLQGAISGLLAKSSDIDSANSIAENYDGKDLVGNVTRDLPNTMKKLMELFANMGNTLGVMRGTPGFDDAQIQPIAYTTGTNPSGNVSKQYLWGGEAKMYNAVAPIAAGSAQGKDFCLATARIYCQLICRDKFGDSSYSEGKGFSFQSEDDALDYVRNEIDSGYPVIIEVDNVGSDKKNHGKHYAMAFALSEEVNEEGKRDILYLDPAAGEIKQLGSSWSEYNLIERNLLYDNSDAKQDSGTQGYWVCSYSGSTPSSYQISNYKEYKDYQGSGEQIDDCHSNFATAGENPYHNPYMKVGNGYPYQASVYLSDGSKICGNGIDLYEKSKPGTNGVPAINQQTTTDTGEQPIAVATPRDESPEEELNKLLANSDSSSAPLAPSLYGYFGPEFLPWIEPGATLGNYAIFNGTTVQNT